MLNLNAPAKINLTLEVLGKRPDGYHEVRSVIQSLSLHDRLIFQTSAEMTFASDSAGWEAEKSLVSAAAKLLRGKYAPGAGAAISLEKRIPLVSGLGGDSSDAAATLRGLIELWSLNLPEKKLHEMAVSLGADVAFFLQGGTALAAGRGERLTPLPPLTGCHFVLVMPELPRPQNKTAQLYAALRPEHYTGGQITERLVRNLKAGKGLDPSHIFNTFENVAFTKFSRLKTYRDHLRKMGAASVHLAGSGPALFTLLRDKEAAEDLYTRCTNQGMETYLVGVGE